MRRYGWAFAVLAVILLIVARFGPAEHPPPEAATTTATAAPVSSSTGKPIVALTGSQGALRSAVTVCVSDPAYCSPPSTVPDPLEGFHGRYSCRFATAGRTTPCCPNATATLALFWSGADLAVADYIAGREGGCKEAIVNSVGCVGWFQLCGESCSAGCRNGYGNSERAFEMWQSRGWQPWHLAGDPVTGRT